MKASVCIHNESQLELFRRQQQIDPQQLRRFRNAVCKTGMSDAKVRSLLPGAEQLKLHVLRLLQQHTSDLDGATKLLFETESGLRLETVLLRIGVRRRLANSEKAGSAATVNVRGVRGRRTRTTVCVSSQVGCAAACTFCATGQMKIARSLSTAEILDQVVQAGQQLAAERQSLNNVVFMGMGEPFHNADCVSEAVDRLLSPRHFDRSPRQILVSTVGVPGAMLAFARQFPGVNLALSLHSVRPEIRRRLIPLSVKHPLEELYDTVRQVNAVQRRPVMMEYLLLDGLNDSDQDARELIHWLAGLRCRVNLIPFNAVTHAPDLRCSPPKRIDRFAACLRSAGLETTVRYSLGRDVAAACGQLVREQSVRRPGAAESATSASDI